jgi:hypothetical protein
MHDVPQLFRERQNNADWTEAFVITDYDASTNVRTPHDLTGAELKMLIKPAAGSAGPTLLLSSSSGGLVTIGSGAAQGDFTINVPAAQMWTLTADTYSADMLLFQNGTTKLVFTLTLEIAAGDTPPVP